MKTKGKINWNTKMIKRFTNYESEFSKYLNAKVKEDNKKI